MKWNTSDFFVKEKKIDKNEGFYSLFVGSNDCEGSKGATIGFFPFLVFLCCLVFTI